MASLVENMFYTGRNVPWHGLGTQVENAPSSADAIRLGGLDWKVVQKKIYTEDGIKINGYSANVRDKDGKSLGIVGSRYSIVQNEDAFKFTDAMLGEGVKYETAGSLKDGRIIWLLAKLPNKYEILGDAVDPYIVFTNTHDGSGAVRVAMTPIRVVCNNTLNFALKTAKRTWSARHTGSIGTKLDDALETLAFADEYMKATQKTFEDLHKIKLNEFEVRSIINNIVPINDLVMKKQQIENQETIRNDILYRFKEAPDLKGTESTGARLIQAVADTVSHIEPFRRTANYEENRLKKAIEGNTLLDKAMQILNVS